MDPMQQDLSHSLSPKYLNSASCVFNKFLKFSQVDKRSKAEDVGLKRGDQILEVNGQSFEHVSHKRALEVLRGTTHLSITVKSNLLGKCF